jgi:endonuclease I
MLFMPTISRSLTIFFSVFYFLVVAQTQLPTSFSFGSTNFPIGWTTKNTSFYNNSGNTPPALKFDNTGDYLMVHFDNSPGDLSYFIVGNLFSNGEFLVEESINGNQWNTLRSFLSLTTTYEQYHDDLNPLSRYVRFKYKLKSTGNVGLDDVTISLGTTNDFPILRCKSENEYLKNKSDCYFENQLVNVIDTLYIFLENIGNKPLHLDSIRIIDNINYSIINQVSSIDSMSIDTLMILCSPIKEGSIYSVLEIYSNDHISSLYEINLKGTVGDLASEPKGDLSNLFFLNVKTYKLEFQFQHDEKVDGFLVLKSTKDSPVSILDGVDYQIGNYIGDWMVVSHDTSTNIQPKSIEANTNYYFKILKFNGRNNYLNYDQSNILEGNIITPPSMLTSDYYSNVTVNNENFVDQLTSTISDHTSFPYSDYTQNLLIPFEIRDTLEHQYTVTCVYSGENVIFDLPFDWSETGLSREHSYCHNWMPTNPANNPEKPEYQDLHHLFPVVFKNVNETRSNYPLGEVIQVVSTYKDCKFGYNNEGKLVFEPRDQHKGDAARAIFYMCTAYQSTTENWRLKPVISSLIPYGQDQVILKKWNLIDPPSNWEIARNDYIAFIQGNRNPFIDHPEYACDIDFYTMEYIDGINCSKLTLETLESGSDVKLSPNPAINQFKLSSNTIIQTITIINEIGVVVCSEIVENNEWEYKGTALRKGVYFLKIETKEKSSIVKLVIH